MIRTAALIAATLLSGTASAKNLVGETVVLRTLDKVTATTQDHRVRVGESLDYGSLNIDVKHCEKKAPEFIPETYVFLQVRDRIIEGGVAELGEAPIFSGWMLGSDPAKAALDHPVYDVWVIACEVPDADDGR